MQLLRAIVEETRSDAGFVRQRNTARIVEPFEL